MPAEIAAIANCDDAIVFWKIKKAIKDCLGFAIEREQRLADGSLHARFLDNRMGFQKDAPKPGDARPSTEWPFQRFSWTDHSVDSGDRVRYRVVPVVMSSGALVQAVSQRSAWTPWLELSGDAGARTSAFFNRGLVISQFMARYLESLRLERGLKTLKDALVEFKKSLEDHETPIRQFLAGTLREELLALLKAAKQKKGHVFAALYELDDEELVQALGSLGGKGHVVLANGSITKKKTETSEQARKRDQNKAARSLLKKKGLEVHNRMISPGALGHNKFLVVTDAKLKPAAVWTGSTNWTKTGLCTQINNGFHVRDRAFAQVYLDQWQKLRDAKSTFPAALVQGNSTAKKVSLGSSQCDVWFTRSSKQVDLKAIEAVVNAAKEGILFLMFQPGGTGTLASIKKRLTQPNGSALYIKGVVSTLPSADGADADYAEISVVGDGKRRSLGLDIVQPQGIKTPFASWAATVNRNDFIPTSGGVVGFAIVHSKLIVVDPFTNPIVITGSHNFSKSASAENDENFVIIRGNDTLALEYAAHIQAVYHHYRWLAFVHEQQQKKKNPKGELAETDAWQQRHLTGASKRETDFWVR